MKMVAKTQYRRNDIKVGSDTIHFPIGKYRINDMANFKWWMQLRSLSPFSEASTEKCWQNLTVFNLTWSDGHDSKNGIKQSIICGDEALSEISKVVTEADDGTNVCYTKMYWSELTHGLYMYKN